MFPGGTFHITLVLQTGVISVVTVIAAAGSRMCQRH
jgi:hypothetical protein